MNEQQQVDAIVGSQTIIYRLKIHDVVKDIRATLFASFLRQQDTDATDGWAKFDGPEEMMEGTGLNVKELVAAEKKLKKLGMLEFMMDDEEGMVCYRLLKPLAPLNPKRRTM